MRTISVVIPTYNEQENILSAYERVTSIFAENLPNYHLQILFIDNCSTDNTRSLITALCEKDSSVSAVFNARNFGYSRSSFYGMLQTTGDAVVLLSADLQEPPEIIPEFVKRWEEGATIVCGIKKKSKESSFVYFLRTCYYRLLSGISETEHIQQFNGFGLYDRFFVDIMKNLKDPLPYLRGIVAELGPKRVEVEYTQEKRNKGKTFYSGFFRLYDFAMLGITSTSKVVMRLATIIGFLISVVSLIIALITVVQKLLNWNAFPLGTASIVVGLFFIGSVQLFFVGLLGEYVLNMNTRIMNRPLVVEERRINLP